MKKEFIYRDYSVRVANLNDCKELFKFEKNYVQKKYRFTLSKIKRRLKMYPEGQFILEMDGSIAGVIYSQRIVDVELLQRVTVKNIDSLHRPDGPVVHLLSMNLHPDYAKKDIKKQFHEYFLQRCGLLKDVKLVVNNEGDGILANYTLGKPADRKNIQIEKPEKKSKNAGDIAIILNKSVESIAGA